MLYLESAHHITLESIKFMHELGGGLPVNKYYFFSLAEISFLFYVPIPNHILDRKQYIVSLQKRKFQNQPLASPEGISN